MKVELSDRAHREMQRINASWRKQADFPELFLDELLETVELIETTGVLGTPYNVKTKHRVTRLRMAKSEYHVYLVRKSDELVVVVSILERSSAPRTEALKPQSTGAIDAEQAERGRARGPRSAESRSAGRAGADEHRDVVTRLRAR